MPQLKVRYSCLDEDWLTDWVCCGYVFNHSKVPMLLSRWRLSDWRTKYAVVVCSTTVRSLYNCLDEDWLTCFLTTMISAWEGVCGIQVVGVICIQRIQWRVCVSVPPLVCYITAYPAIASQDTSVGNGATVQLQPTAHERRGVVLLAPKHLRSRQ